VPEPRLIDVLDPREPAGVVLVLHGGGSRGNPVAVSPSQLSVLRMIPVAHAVARAGHGRLAVLRLLNAFRGWATDHTPIQDVDWALGKIARRYGAGMPVCLVGHSLGGRAALCSAQRPAVHGVVALAPWVYPDDVDPAVSGTPIVIIHGDADRIAAPERSRRVAEGLRRHTPVTYITVTGGKHAMLSHRGDFDTLAARCAAWMLLGESTDPIVARIAAGENDVTV
jgi:alpha-beta hydrolase superfamily lysophospholipase